MSPPLVGAHVGSVRSVLRLIRCNIALPAMSATSSSQNDSWGCEATIAVAFVPGVMTAVGFVTDVPPMLSTKLIVGHLASLPGSLRYLAGVRVEVTF